MRELRYIRAIINETLRLWPILPYTRKAALQDLALPVGGKNGGPVAVLKGRRSRFHSAKTTDTTTNFIQDLSDQVSGSEIYYSANSMHRRPEHWGPDAGVFRPERFIENGGVHKPWTYLCVPFCIPLRLYFGTDQHKM